MRTGTQAQGRALAAAAAIAAVGCAPRTEAAYPLYDHVPGERLPPDQVARLYGAVSAIDGRDVSNLGGAYELLPGCHELTTSGQSLNDATSYYQVTARLRPQRFVLAMKAGYSYFLKHTAPNPGSRFRIFQFVEERDASDGQTGIVEPAKADT